jgi:hypothetical protein
VTRFIALVKQFAPWGLPVTLLAFLATTVPHTAMLLQPYEDFWPVAWFLSIGLDIAIVILTYYARVRRGVTQRVIVGVLVAFFLASAAVNVAYYVSRGMGVVLAAIVGTAIVGGVASLSLVLALVTGRADGEDKPKVQDKAGEVVATKAVTKLDRAEQLQKLGWTRKAIAADCGVSERTIRRWIG